MTINLNEFQVRKSACIQLFISQGMSRVKQHSIIHTHFVNKLRILNELKVQTINVIKKQSNKEHMYKNYFTHQSVSQSLLAFASTMLGPHECQPLLNSLATRGSGTESHSTVHTVSKFRSFWLATFRALIAFVWLVRSDCNARLQLLPPSPFGGPGDLGSSRRRGKSGGRGQLLGDWCGRQTGWR